MPSNSTPAVGSKVGVHYGGSIVIAFVVEDRGLFGGQRIVRVHIGDRDDVQAPEFEVPVDELVAAPATA